MHLTLGHRPRLKNIPKMAAEYDLVVVLLKPTEGTEDLLAHYLAAGLPALHAPFTVGLPNREPLTWGGCSQVRQAVTSVSGALAEGLEVFVHCSAGIHRTGTFSYAVLRHTGYTQKEALDHIKSLREVTYLGMLPFVKWAEDTLVDPAWVHDRLEA